jgi:uncharacterized protein GlcG (DUF336 family)
MSAFPFDTAHRIVVAAIAEARKLGFKPMGVVAVDAAGQVVASARDDGASALRLDIALGKCNAAIGMGVNSRVLVERTKSLPVFFSAVASVAEQKFVPQTGAVLVRDAAGTLVGAVGASGGTGDEDEQIVMAAVTANGLRHDA